FACSADHLQCSVALFSGQMVSSHFLQAPAHLLLPLSFLAWLGLTESSFHVLQPVVDLANALRIVYTINKLRHKLVVQPGQVRQTFQTVFGDWLLGTRRCGPRSVPRIAMDRCLRVFHLPSGLLTAFNCGGDGSAGIIRQMPEFLGNKTVFNRLL